jgi:hypothetical protein
MRQYILDKNGEPKPAKDLMEWAGWFSNDSNNRIVKKDKINNLEVSTIFLGLDHNFSSRHDAVPILWETMIFNDNESIDCERCSGGREQAEAMHFKMIEKAKSL